MNVNLAVASDQRIPRYTSYPTAPHFTPDIDSETYAAWLVELPSEETLSLYLHIPFCAELCLYCGCHTTVARRYAPIAAYVELIKSEIDLVSRHLGEGRPVAHIHWGGGTPTIVSPQHLLDIMQVIRDKFDVRDDAEIAIEIDPRTLTFEHVAALAEMGINRASVGVQDFDETVQRTVNRIQSYDETATTIAWLRDAGISNINLDLMYGLPHQTVGSVLSSIDQALKLKPDRIALFGYAHVPWMKRHQALLSDENLPDAADRINQMDAAREAICQVGYVPIGLDHFALPDDRAVLAQKSGHLRRNFQGYTTDGASTLIGFGTSSIGSLPQGYVQNASKTLAYRSAIMGDEFATVRGTPLTAEDRLRRDVIERLMCDLSVDLEAIAFSHGRELTGFASEIEAVDALARDGLVKRNGFRIIIPEEARAYVRMVCAVFDQYLLSGAQKYSRAV